MNQGFHKHQKQRGIALIFVLLILVVVSLLGVGGAQLAMMGERGARNERDSQIAKQYAEAALIDAEFDIRGPGISPRKNLFDSEMNFANDCGTTGTLQGLCAQTLSGKPVWLTVDFMDTSSTPPYTVMGAQTGRTVLQGVQGTGLQPALAPRYIVEWLPDSSPGVQRSLNKKEAKRLYRVTTMGFGPRDDIRTVLQMIFRKE
jgi:type IV pilus assembly protein PilX